jgi:hypothetical protein
MTKILQGGISCLERIRAVCIRPPAQNTAFIRNVGELNVWPIDSHSSLSCVVDFDCEFFVKSG